MSNMKNRHPNCKHHTKKSKYYINMNVNIKKNRTETAKKRNNCQGLFIT